MFVYQLFNWIYKAIYGEEPKKDGQATCGQQKVVAEAPQAETKEGKAPAGEKEANVTKETCDTTGRCS